MRYLAQSIVLALATLMPLSAAAHKASDSYLTLDVTGNEIHGRWDMALRDLDYAIGLDGNDDGAITWGELRDRHDAIAGLALSRLRLATDGRACRMVPDNHKVADHSDGAYAVLQLIADCGRPVRRLDVAYNLFFDFDPRHRGLLQIKHGDSVATAVLSPENNQLQLDLSAASAWWGFFDYVRDGAWHIWTGIDHILFLLALLLPAVVIHTDRRWRPVGNFPQALRETVKVVTAFTIAHSITLSLAALVLIDLPSRLVESVIAASIVIAALNNIFPLVRRRIWAIAFAFGLVHGLGFANVLADLGLARETLVASLIGFNLGVEFGQLAIVAAFLPLAFLLRRWRGYPAVAIQLGSLAVAVVGGIWFAERALDIDLWIL